MPVNVCSLASSAGIWGRWIEQLTVRNSWFGYASLGQVDAIDVTGVDRIELDNLRCVGKANRLSFQGGCPQVRRRTINPEGETFIENFGSFAQPTVYVVEQQGLPAFPYMTTS